MTAGTEPATSNPDSWPIWKDAHILAARGPRADVDPFRPVGLFREQELGRARAVIDTATILLANKECPFRCLHCDLWQHTTVFRVPAGAIPRQIDQALLELWPDENPVCASGRQIKLYNSGNFFDIQAIPPEDYGEIISRVRGFDTVIVENHPKLCSSVCGDFQARLGTRLEVAVGLETVHPQLLQRLNKRMTVDDFRGAAERLRAMEVGLRVFVLLKPPFLTEQEGIDWAIETVQVARTAGADCCSIIPMRAGNGAIDRLSREGWFSPPSLRSLEQTLEIVLRAKSSPADCRLFADLWNIESLSACPRCQAARIERLRQMNLTQTVPPPIDCPVCRAAGG